MTTVVDPPSALFALPRRVGLGWLTSLAEHLSGLRALSMLYARRPARLTAPGFIRFALDQLAVSWTLRSGNADRIPRRGGLIVISNHPLGAADGLVLADLLMTIRLDVLLLANSLLARIPELRSLIAPVEVFRPQASLRGVRMAQRHLRSGGVLVVFPAGEVSRLDWRQRRVTDPAWTHTTAVLAQQTGAAVLPVRIEGRASLPSLLAGWAHARLRTALLGRDLLAQRNSTIGLHLGEPIPPSELARMSRPTATAYLRLLSECLGPPDRLGVASPPAQALAEPQPAERLAREIAQLPDRSLLCAQGPFEVYCVGAGLIPTVLREIGRLRELSFRQVQEGTGQALDLDRFDHDYQHLFLWHRQEQTLIGAYRIGFTNALVAQSGLPSLYTHTLFRYDEALLAHIGPALELGRSFVRPEWQRNFRSLRLLWSGIATMLDRYPEIRCLFGPVSISASYSPMARTLMESALSRHHADALLCRLVQPRTPPPGVRRHPGIPEVVAGLSDPDLLSRAIARLDHGSGLPVLVRHYLQLKGRFAGFNVDAAFGNTLDGLVFVRVADIPPQMREKFGRPGLHR